MASSQPTILVTGADGQVGNALLKTLSRLGRVVGSTVSDTALSVPTLKADLSKESEVRALVREVKPQVIVNPAAHTAVDKAEGEPDLAYALNETAPRILAEEAKALGIPLVHYSTDYVFDGSGHLPRKEDAPTNPLSVYGASKLAGEQAIAATGAHALIFRTSWVFSDHGHNFVKTMLRLGKEREELKIVGDQVGAPTQAGMLAAMTALALGKGFAQGFEQISGLYHLCNAGETSWQGFAAEIFRQARHLGLDLQVKTVQPISTAEYPTPARRPLNSRLDCSKFCRTFGVSKLPLWQESLGETLKSLLGTP
jgi:dTDP-4-dehydrorhamnose reductase